MTRSFTSTRRTLGEVLHGCGARIAVLGVCQIAAAVFEATTIGLLIPFLAAIGAASATVDLSFLGPPAPTGGLPVRVAAGVLIAAVGCRTLAQTIAAWYWSQSVEYFEQRRRLRLIEAYTAASWDCQSREPAGRLQQLLLSNVEQVAKAFTAAAYSLSYAVGLLVLATYAFSISFVHSATALVVLGGLALAARPLTRRARAAAAQRAAALSAFANLISQGAALAKELRVFQVAAWFTSSAARLSEEIGATRRRQNLAGAVVPVVYQNGSAFLLVAGAALALAFGPAAGAASLIVSALLLIRAVSYGQHLHATYHQLEECVPYLEQLQAAQQAYDACRVGGGTASLSRIREIEFDAVSFAYDDDRPALTDVSFRVAAGNITAVVGPSGAGKSTLAQLLLGLREPQIGTLRINGEPRRRFSLDDWFARTAFVPQDLTLFDETIAECIRFHRADVSPEQVRRAAEQAGILDEILQMPLGFDTPVGDRGGALSQGQRQRVCIARALVGDPDLLIFDEPTSALDPDSEARVLQTLGALSGEKIVFVLAHRAATLGACNKVLVLRDGRLTAFRDLDADIEPNAYYRELTASAEA